MESSDPKEPDGHQDFGESPVTLKRLLFGFSDLLFNLDSALWRTLIGLAWTPLQTNKQYLVGGHHNLLNPLKVLVGLCTLSVVVWAIHPTVPSQIELLESAAPESMAELRESVEEAGATWQHFGDVFSQRVSLLNTPFVLLLALPVMVYLKLIRRDRRSVGHAIFTLNAFNVFLMAHIISYVFYFLPLGPVLISLIPLLGVLVPYLLFGLWHFYYPKAGRFLVCSLGLISVLAVSYLVTSNLTLLLALEWARRSVVA